MSKELAADDLTLPIKRTDGETIKERLTGNAYHNILPARYLRKDSTGELAEQPEELFERVAKNIALAETVFEARKRDIEISVTPDQLKPDHPRRDQLAAEVFGKGVAVGDDAERTLSEYNVNKFAYETVVPELPAEVRDHVKATAREFQESMERLSFMPNSPTLMNAGDELQQLSACFVDSPEDDIDDIHQTAKEAAQVFQCLTEDSTVTVEDRGAVSVSDVEVGDRVLQKTDSGFQYRRVEETHEYEAASTLTVSLSNGRSIRGTPNHRIKVDGEWTRLDEIEPGQGVHYALGWLREEQRERPTLASVTARAQWSDESHVDNADIAEHHNQGRSDHEIADCLDCGTSTVQRRRSEKPRLPPNVSGGEKQESVSFDESEALELYQQGDTDSEGGDSPEASASSVQRFRTREQSDQNGQPVKTVTRPERLTDELAELVGLWLGDGSWHENGICFHVERESIAEYIDQLSQKLFDTESSVTVADGRYEIIINGHEIKRWWETNFDCRNGARSAHVPERIKQAPAHLVEAFLRGCFTADGTLHNETDPALYSSSEAAIDDVATLMMGLGYRVETSVIRDEDAHPYYGVIPTTAAGREAFVRDVGFIDARQERALDSIGRTECRDPHSPGEEYTVEVDAVAESADATVYDITVADNHQYVTDGIVSHNSGGGMGYAFWRLRPYGDPVGSTGGIASGPVTFMRTYDQLCETIAQGGARRGAQMGVMRVSHPDVIQFIHAKNKDVSLANTLRLNDPDDFTHTSFAEALEEARNLIDDEGRVPEHLRNAVEGHLSNFNISVGVTDRFMEAVEHGEVYTLTNPRTEEPHVATKETVELYEMFGLGEYVEAGEVLSVPARELWEHIIEGAHENGEPGVIYLERVNKKHSFDVEEHPDHRILSTNPSLAAGTRVLTDRGVVGIEELEGDRFEVPTLSGEWADAVCQQSGTNEPLYEVELSNGKSYLATKEHKWPVLKDGSYERTKTTEIKTGDNLPIGRRDRLQYGSEGTYDNGMLVGWLYGDGSITEQKNGRTQYGFTFSQADADSGMMDRVLDALESLTGVEYDPTKRQRDGKPWYEVHASNADIRRFMSAFGVRAKEDGVPDALWRDASESFRKGFIDGLFSADGRIDRDQNRVVLVSPTERLVNDVSDLLGFYGLKTSTRESESKRWGEVYHRWNLQLSRTQAHRFRQVFEISHESKAASLSELETPDRENPLSDNVVVEAVRETNERGPVWDLRVDEKTHTFALSQAFTGNCGEQPLEEYEACNLGHINLSTLAAEDAPDWRVWSERHADEYTTESEAVEAFLAEAIDFEEFDRRIELGTRFLEDVVTMSDFPVEKIEETVREMRKIGLGIMGLAQLYIQLGTKYGSDTANEIARQLLVHINHHSKWTSHELATERGTFTEWDNSKYADPTEYREWFEHQTGRSADDWADGFPIRNHNTTTIAPTGTTSMIGNTTGGCEPIYNVAYYKNVSDDVQGDEMLVEFDDYFLRVLKDNGIDVKEVKEEAKAQMADNEFNGVEGLSTVPDAIGELFVTTGDLSAKQHASVQCSCQSGVDSAISKTVNAPNDSTVEDAKEVFEYIYEHGGKGVTYYRDGTRSKQVLTTRAQNTEFAEMDEAEAIDFIIEQIDKLFGGIEGFLENEEIRERLSADIEELLAEETRRYAQKKPRPDQLHGVTQRIETGYGKLYVTINEDPETGEPFELFANTGHSGGFTNSFTDALAKTISVALRSGVDPHEIVDKLQGIRSPKVAWDKGQQINSIPDAFGTALRRHIDNEIDTSYPDQATLEETAGGDERSGQQAPDPETDGAGVDAAERSAAAIESDHQTVVDAGENPECPECGSLSLYYAEGCKTCESCGWSEC